VEDRISGLKKKTCKKKPEKFLDKRLKNYERNMQELCDSNKRLNL
jgi:hypothetical protein